MDYKVITEWKGTHLTNAAFLNYAKDVLRVVKKYDTSDLQIADEVSSLESGCDLMADFVKNERAYTESAMIAAADAKRDATFNAVWHAWNFLSKIGKDDDFGHHAFILKPLMDAYKGIARHELSRETEEINGLKHDFDTNSDYRLAATALGFNPMLNALYAANAVVEQWLAQRQATSISRDSDKQGETAPSLRKRMSGNIIEIFDHVNAYNKFNCGPETYNLAIDLDKVVETHKKIASQAKSRKGDDPDGGETPEQA